MFRGLLFLFSLLLGSGAYAEPSWDQIELRSDLYQLRNQEIQNGLDIPAANRTVLAEVSAHAPKTEGRADGVTLEQAQKILKLTNSNPVTGWAGNAKYDPQGRLGFCFGRALYAHLELLRHGVADESIKKAFVVGPMKAGGIDWQFHVATLVKAKDQSGWYAIDTFLGKVVPADQWFANFEKYSTDGKLRLYVTRPAKIGPSSWEYNIRPGGLFDSFYNEYFKELFKYFRAHPVAAQDKFVQRCSAIFL